MTPLVAGAVAKRKLSYKEQRELTTLPGRIEALESERASLDTTMASSAFYKEPADVIARVMGRSAEVDQELLTAYARWDALDSRS